MTNHYQRAVEHEARAVEVAAQLDREHKRSHRQPHVIAELSAERSNAMAFAKIHAGLAQVEVLEALLDEVKRIGLAR